MPRLSVKFWKDFQQRFLIRFFRSLIFFKMFLNIWQFKTKVFMNSIKFLLMTLFLLIKARNSSIRNSLYSDVDLKRLFKIIFKINIYCELWTRFKLNYLTNLCFELYIWSGIQFWVHFLCFSHFMSWEVLIIRTIKKWECMQYSYVFEKMSLEVSVILLYKQNLKMKVV